MPVHMEWIESPSDQDWIDLEKLYKEAPAHWFDAEANAKSYTQIKANAGYKLVAGRFNDRLIAAAALKADAQGVLEIEDLCVRQVTQERGVAKQLLTRICQWANEQGKALKVAGKPDDYSVLAEFDFVHHNEYWVRSAR